jgi:hypothetical protein
MNSETAALIPIICPDCGELLTYSVHPLLIDFYCEDCAQYKKPGQKKYVLPPEGYHYLDVMSMDTREREDFSEYGFR